MDLCTFPEISSYQSCITNYKRSILPPLITSIQQKDLKEIQAKAIIIEEKINNQNELKMNLKKVVTSAAEVFQVIKNFQTEPQKNITIAKDSKVINKNEITNKNETQKKIPTVDDSKTVNQNEITNNDFTTNTTFRPGIHYEEVVESSDSSVESLPTEICQERICQNASKTVPAVTHNNWISDGVVNIVPSSEPNIFNLPLPQSDTDSISTSGFRSTDLDKCLDSSIDYGHLSETSIEEKTNICQDAESTEESSGTLIDSSQNPTPVSLIENPNDIIKISKETNSSSQLSCNSNLSTCQNHSTESQKSTWLKKVLNSSHCLSRSETGVSEIDTEYKNIEDNHSRHVRSNSYTLDSPSPVLLSSHSGCSCVKSQELANSPHSVCLHNKHVYTENARSVENFKSMLQNEEKICKSSSLFENVKKPTEQSCEENITQNSCFDRIYQNFVKVRDQAFMNLKEEHARQWDEMMKDFKEKENFFRENKLISPSMSSQNSKISNSEKAISSKNQTFSQSLFPSLSEMRSLIANNTMFTNYQKQNINEPEMKRKFDRLSAAVKGYLTRCLFNTKVVRSLIQNITKDAAELCHIHSSIIQRKGVVLEEEKKLYIELKMRINSMDAELHNIFFGLSKKEQMNLISENRKLKKQEEEMKEEKQNKLLLEKAHPPVLPLVHVSNEHFDALLPSNVHVSKQKSSVTKATILMQQRRKNEGSSHPDLSVSKKPLHKKDGIHRKRILSPRSCAISPPSHRNRPKSNPVSKKNETANKTRRALY